MGYVIKVPLSKAQETLQKLISEDLLDNTKKYSKDSSHIYFPVKKQIKGYELIELNLPEKKPSKNVKQALKSVLEQEELPYLKTSFDVVGQIAIMEIDKELEHKKHLLAEELLKTVPQIKTVVRKQGSHYGELRIQQHEYLAGEKTFDTIVKENSVSLYLNINKTYYSVRSSTERKRISKLINPGERVLVMFSGIAPFVCVIAKNTQAKEVIGVELNEQAHEYALKNLELNKIQNAKVIQGDVREVVPELGFFDRIIMPLPHTAHNFLPLAIKAIKQKGHIHLYHFSTEDEVKKYAKKIENNNLKVEHIQRCGNLGPGIHRWCLDIKINQTF